MGCRLVDSDTPGVDGAGAGHHADKQLLPETQLGGVVPGPIQILRHPLRLLRLSGQIDSRLKVLCITELAAAQRPALRKVSVGASDLFSLRRARVLKDGGQEQAQRHPCAQAHEENSILPPLQFAQQKAAQGVHRLLSTICAVGLSSSLRCGSCTLIKVSASREVDDVGVHSSNTVLSWCVI